MTSKVKKSEMERALEDIADRLLGFDQMEKHDTTETSPYYLIGAITAIVERGLGKIQK